MPSPNCGGSSETPTRPERRRVRCAGCTANVTRNAVHASDSVENARMEASRFFREEDIVVARYEPKEE